MSEPFGMDRARFDDLKDAYALGALSKDEHRAFERYLARNPELQSEVDDVVQITSLLALSPQELSPSPRLRNELLNTVRSEASTSRSRSQRRVSLLDRLRSVLPARPLVVGVASLVVVALVSWNVALQNQMTDLHRENSTLMAEMEQMTGEQISGGQIYAMQAKGAMSSVEAEVVETKDGRAVLIADGLPKLEEGQTFQMWVINGEDVKPGGVFDSGDRTVAAALEQPLKDADTVAVTVEPEGGSPQPTSSPELTASV